MRVVYISRYALPTYKADGLQDVRMCEAFSRRGLDVVLLYPRYHSQRVPSGSMREYYGVTADFSVKPFEVAAANLKIPSSRVYMPVALLHALAVAGLVARQATKEDARLYYTRDLLVAWWLTYMGHPTVFEAMSHPSRRVLPFVRSMFPRESLLFIIPITGYLAKHLLAKVNMPKNKVLPLHVGVDSWRLESAINQQSARESLGLPQTEKLAVYTGGLREDRGIDTIIHASLVLDDVHFVIVGGRPREVDRMQALAKRVGADRVTIYGQTEPQRAFLFQKAADVLLLPQRGSSPHLVYYTSPAKLFEYMATSNPIVAADLPCMKEVLVHEENALLVNNDAHDEWAQAISLLLADRRLRNRLAVQAKNDVRQFTWDTRVGHILDRVALRDRVCRTTKGKRC